MMPWRTFQWRKNLSRVPSQAKKTPINDEILVPEVRLIAADGHQIGVLPTEKARDQANRLELDLVLIVPNAKPPVAKMMNYGRHVFAQKKVKAELRKKKSRIQVKEVKFRPGTDEGDYRVKLRNLIRFLEAKHKTKITMRFRGRELAHQEIGSELLRRVEQDLSDYGVVESPPKLEGRQLTMVMAPRLGKGKNRSTTQSADVR